MDAEQKRIIFGKDYYYGQKFSNYKNYDRFDNDLYWRPVLKTLRALKAGGKILDVGCALGYFLKRTATMFQELHGIDISPFAIEKAKQNLPEGKFQVLDIDTDELPYPDEYFNVIASFDVLEHTRSIQDSLNKIILKLKRGGYLIFSVPLKSNLAAWIFHFTDKETSHVSVPTKKELAQFISQSGLKLVQQRRFFYTPYFIRIPGIPGSCESVLQKI